MSAVSRQPAAAVDEWRDAPQISRRGLAFDLTVAALFTLSAGLAEASTSTTAVIITVILGVGLALRRICLPGMVVAAVAAAGGPLVGKSTSAVGSPPTCTTWWSTAGQSCRPQADGARNLLRSDPDRAEQALLIVGDTARMAMTDVRTLLTRRRTPPPTRDSSRQPGSPSPSP